MEYQKISPKARGCMLVNAVLLAALSTVALTLVWWLLWEDSFPVGFHAIWCLAALIWAVSLAEPFIRYERYRYRFTEEEIDVREGFIYVTRQLVPIERLHKIEMVSGPVDRFFGLTKVIVTTAGGAVVIRFLEVEMAERIVGKLNERINQYAVAEREKGGEDG